MKKILLSIFVCSLVLSCRKEKVQNKIIGKWEYRAFAGYPFNFPSYPPGNGKIIIFNSDGTFSHYSHDTLIYKGSYILKRNRDCSRDQNGYFLFTGSPSFSNLKAEVRKYSLFLSTSSCVADGGVSIYEKVGNSN